MLHTEKGEVEANHVWEFYSKLPCPVLVGIEATGSMHWFLNLVDELMCWPAWLRREEPRHRPFAKAIDCNAFCIRVRMRTH